MTMTVKEIEGADGVTLAMAGDDISLLALVKEFLADPGPAASVDGPMWPVFVGWVVEHQADLGLEATVKARRRAGAGREDI